MIRFVELIHKLEDTNSTNKKIELIKEYYATVDAKEKLYATALFCGKKPKRPVPITVFKTWVSELTNLPLWLIDESHHIVGDLSETISLLVPQNNHSHGTITLSQVVDDLYALNKKNIDEVKATIIHYWQSFDSYSCFVFNKLLSGSFRVGVSQTILTKALADYLQYDQGYLHLQLMGNWDPRQITWEDLTGIHKKEKHNSQPYPFYLAHALEHTVQLNDFSSWIAEYKWDGIRAQIIKRNRQIYIWSRGEELITERFPEIVSGLTNLPDGCVLDGELLLYQDGKVLPFQLLQTRINRKVVSAKLLQTHPAGFIAYDILEYEGEDIRHLPLLRRKELLQPLMTSLSSNHIFFSPVYHFQNIDELIELKTTSVYEGAEGLMIKAKESTYQFGRKKGAWWKWKKEPYTVDAVLIYAIQGSGRRANLLTDYTFAVWKGEELVPFTKAYSGLSDKEIKEVDQWVRKNTIEKFGPVRSVTADLVFEIAFEDINESTRHKSGIAVRFPRIHRWRKDKKASDADTLENLFLLLNEKKKNL
jgi:DNA ligase-1